APLDPHLLLRPRPPGRRPGRLGRQGRRVGPVRPRRTRPEQRRRLRGVAPPLPARGTGGRKTNSVPSTASVPVGELTGIVGQDPDVGAVAHGFDGITVEDRPSATTYSRTPPPTSTI